MKLVSWVQKKGKTLKPLLLPIWMFIQRNRLWQWYCTLHKRVLKQRNVHAFSIGLPKTGTTSIAEMVQCNSAHEPETHTLLYLYDQYEKGKMTIGDQVRILRARDVSLWLELESNHMFGLIIEGLVAAFPEARFVMTVREPKSWLESQINQHFEKGHIEPYKSAYQRMYGGAPTTASDANLISKGLYGVSGYLSYWAEQNLRVINTVPSHNLKVVWTQDITKRAGDVAKFLGVDSIDQERTHGNRRPNKKLILDDLLDPSYLDNQLYQHTHEAMSVIQKWTNTTNQ